MAEIPTTYADDPTAAKGLFRLNPPGETGGLEGTPENPYPLAAPGTALAIPQLERLEQRRQEAIAGRQTELDREASELAQAYRNRPQTPGLGKVGPAPDAQDFQKNTMAFFSVMSVLGALMPGISRGAGNAALNAFGGALDGWHKGNLEAYENATKQWEQNTKAMIENNNFLIKQYDMELQNTALTIEQMQANIKLKAAQFYDKIAYDNAENITVIAQYRDKLEKETKSAEAITKPLTDQAVKIRAQVDLKAEQQALWVAQHGFVNPDGTPMSTEDEFKTRYLLQREGGKAMGALTSMYDPKEIDQLARQELTGDHSWKQNVGRGAQGSAKLDAVAAKVSEIMTSEGITPEERSRRDIAFQARRAEATAAGRTKGVRETNLDIILNVTNAAIPAALAASEQVPRGSFVPINQIVQKGQILTSNLALRKFGMANLQLAEGWARAMNPTGVMRESDRDLALSFLSTADNKETYKGLVEQLRIQIQRERTAIESGTQEVLSAPGGGSIPPAAAPTGGEIPPGWNVEKH